MMCFQKTAIILFLMICFLFSASCKKDSAEVKTKKEEDKGIHKTFERGPITVLLEVDQKEITIADRLNFLINITIDEDYEIDLPGFGEKLEQFGIIDYHTSQPELVENNRTKISRSYILEPFLSGNYTIPPMKISFWQKGEKETNLHEIETGELVIKVTSLLPETKKNLKLHDIKPPVNLPRSFTVWIWIGVVAGFIIAVIIIIVIIDKKQSDKKDAPEKIPPHEIAFLQIEQLVNEKLIEKDEIKLFYQRISNILRYYIENRFGLHAPEQTTEEFLTEIEAKDKLPARFDALLKEFLIHCDLVKFAEFQPTTEDIQKAFDSCKAFITETSNK